MKTIKTLFTITLLLVASSLFAQNLALNRTATASTEARLAKFAVDGKDQGGSTGETRWESVAGDTTQWLIVKLDSAHTISKINIHWEGANAKEYDICLSQDSITWDTVYSKTDGANGHRWDYIDLDNDAVYVQVFCKKRNLTYGYSIWELEVEGAPVGHVSVLDSISLEKDKSRIAVNEDLIITASGVDEDGFSMITAPIWTANGGSITNGVFNSTTKGTFTITATDGSISNSIEIKVGDPQVTGTVAYATSGNSPAFAVDNNMGTRWNSDSKDTAAIAVSLQNVYAVSEVMIHWENANAKVYGLDYSLDSINWVNIDSITNGTFGSRTDAFEFTVSARYIRMNATKRTSTYANSVWEFQVFGVIDTPTTIHPTKNTPALTLYPNPVADQLFISSEVAVGRVSIYSLSGQMVKSVVPNGNSVDVSDLSKGYYLTKISLEDGTSNMSRIVKL